MSARPLRRSALAAIVTMVAIAGCGSDTGSEPAEVADTSAVSTAGRSADGTATDESSAESSATLSGAEICERLNIDSVAADLGLDVVAVEPDDTGTPQCAYDYTNASGMTSNLTVAAMRPEDVGGATGADAFDLVVDVNRGLGGDDTDVQEIDAGDGAVRMTGPALHFGVVRVGDHVYTLIVPAGDAEVDAVDHLIGTMATTLG
jgi:hypothetical protein